MGSFLKEAVKLSEDSITQAVIVFAYYYQLLCSTIVVITILSVHIDFFSKVMCGGFLKYGYPTPWAVPIDNDQLPPLAWIYCCPTVEI